MYSTAALIHNSDNKNKNETFGKTQTILMTLNVYNVLY